MRTADPRQRDRSAPVASPPVRAADGPRKEGRDAPIECKPRTAGGSAGAAGGTSSRPDGLTRAPRARLGDRHDRRATDARGKSPRGRGAHPFLLVGPRAKGLGPGRSPRGFGLSLGDVAGPTLAP